MLTTGFGPGYSERGLLFKIGTKTGTQTLQFFLENLSEYWAYSNLLFRTGMTDSSEKVRSIQYWFQLAIAITS
jgi:hypothetical protein